jgi:uncharacterized protein YcnI
MKTGLTISFGALTLLLASAAHGHITIASGPGVSDTSNEIVFLIGHGCGTPEKDTAKLTVDIPDGVTSVKAMPSTFGAISFVKDGTTVKSVSWTKTPGDISATDDFVNKLTIRARLPKAPFSKLYFPVHQTCAEPGGANPTTVDQVNLPLADGGAPSAAAPILVVLPTRVAGWNKFTVPAAVTDLNAFFKDALIVWKGNSAFSANPATAAQIATESGVTPLTSIAANEDVWVKY